MLKVVDAEKKPIAGVEVQVNGLRCEEEPSSWFAWPTELAGPMPILKTDQSGEASFSFPQKFRAASIQYTITTLTFNFRHADYISQPAEAEVKVEKPETLPG